jgi:hypothetical protein
MLKRRTPLNSKPRTPAKRAKRGMRSIPPLAVAANYRGTLGPAQPKDPPARNAALLDMARGRRCLLMADRVRCRGLDGETTVACHQNEGKGEGLKVSDERTVWGCVACHDWYDRSGALRTEKRRAFFAAHARQIQMWELVSKDNHEPERFRKAALWALERVREQERLRQQQETGEEA